MKKLLLTVLALHVALVPCFADVIPSKYDDKDAASKKAVQSRMEQVGAPSAAAETAVKHLNAEELAFFAQNPDRIQAAGGLWWYEWLLGAATLGLMTVLYFTVTD